MRRGEEKGKREKNEEDSRAIERRCGDEMKRRTKCQE